MEFFRTYTQEKPFDIRSRISRQNTMGEFVYILVDRLTRKDPRAHKHKFVVSRDYTFQRFIDEILSDNIEPYIGDLFLYTNNSLVSNDVMVGSIYDSHKSDDGSLYLAYSIKKHRNCVII